MVPDPANDWKRHSALAVDKSWPVGDEPRCKWNRFLKTGTADRLLWESIPLNRRGGTTNPRRPAHVCGNVDGRREGKGGTPDQVVTGCSPINVA